MKINYLSEFKLIEKLTLDDMPSRFKFTYDTLPMQFLYCFKS
ncbi:MAG: hypothetical protein SNG10_07090 [Rikenellaceae bacterium]